MVLKKLLSKKKDSQNYFLEVDVKDEAPAQNEVATNVDSVMEQVEAKTNEEGEVIKKLAAPSPQSSSDDTPDWVKAIKNYSDQNSNNASTTEDMTYAGKYVTNNVPQSRRRPGPSLNPFKNIASQINK